MADKRSRVWRIADRIYDTPGRVVDVVAAKLLRPPGMTDGTWIAMKRWQTLNGQVHNPLLPYSPVR